MAANYETEDLRARTQKFAVRIVRLSQSLPKTAEARVLGNPLLRSGTSVAANYRAAYRVRPRPEFVAKLGVVVEETAETLFWLDFCWKVGFCDLANLTV